MIQKTKQTLHAFYNREDGLAFIEFALIFPLLLTMMLGVWDVGHALWVNQKAIAASHTVADLVARQLRVSEDEVTQAMLAGELVMSPFPTEDRFYLEILSVGFDDEGNIDDDPETTWQKTTDDAPVKQDLYDKIEPLAIPYEGVIAVRVTYDYEPTFGSFIIDRLEMKETAFARGRKTAVIQAEWE